MRARPPSGLYALLLKRTAQRCRLDDRAQGLQSHPQTGQGRRTVQGKSPPDLGCTSSGGTGYRDCRQRPLAGLSP